MTRYTLSNPETGETIQTCEAESLDKAAEIFRIIIEYESVKGFAFGYHINDAAAFFGGRPSSEVFAIEWRK